MSYDCQYCGKRILSKIGLTLHHKKCSEVPSDVSPGTDADNDRTSNNLSKPPKKAKEKVRKGPKALYELDESIQDSVEYGVLRLLRDFKEICGENHAVGMVCGFENTPLGAERYWIDAAQFQSICNDDQELRKLLQAAHKSKYNPTSQKRVHKRICELFKVYQKSVAEHWEKHAEKISNFFLALYAKEQLK